MNRSTITPIISAIISALVLVFGSNLLQNYFKSQQLFYETTIQPSPTGLAFLKIENPSKTTCNKPHKMEFISSNAKIISAKLVATNEDQRNIKITHDDNRIEIVSNRLAGTGFIKTEFSYTDMRGESVLLKAPSGVGCENGVYGFKNASSEQIYPLIGISFIPIYVLVGLAIVSLVVVFSVYRMTKL